MQTDSAWKWLETHRDILIDPDRNKMRYEEFSRILGAYFFRYFQRKNVRTIDCEELSCEIVEQIALNYCDFDFLGTGSFRAWCTKIARNLAINRSKASSQDANFPSDFFAERSWKQEDPQHDEDGLWLAFSRLTERDQQILAMRFIDGVPSTEIAEILQISKANARQRCRRAKLRLKSLMQESTPIKNLE